MDEAHTTLRTTLQSNHHQQQQYLVQKVTTKGGTSKFIWITAVTGNAQQSHKARGSGKHTVDVLLLSLAKVLPPSLKLAVPERLPKSPVAPLLMLRLVDMRLQLACTKHTKQ